MMPLRRVSAAIFLIWLATFGLTSCFVRRRLIVRPGGHGNGSPALLVTNREALSGVIQREYDAVRDFNATVDMTPALGSAEKNKITEYKDVRGLHPVSPPGGYPHHRVVPRGAQ